MSLSATRTFAVAIAIADLAGTILQVTSYHSHAESTTLLLEIALILHGLHAFTWFGALLAASGGPGRRFSQMIYMTYVGAAFFDFASVIVRLFVSAPWPLFAHVTFWGAGALLALDLVGALFFWLLLRGTRDENESEKRGRSDVRTSVMPWLWMLEIILFALIIFTWAAGLNRSTLFARVILLETPHVFVWLLYRAITGGLVTDDGVDKIGWIWMALVTSLGMSLLGAAATSTRLYYMFSDADSPPALLPVLHDVYGWIQLALGGALFAISLLQFFGFGSLMSSAPREIELSESLARKK